jgi:hypothetical protein
MALGNGALMMVGLLIAGAANSWRHWHDRLPSPPSVLSTDPTPSDTTTNEEESTMRLERLTLPGVGTRFRFPTNAGKWVGVIRHLDGRRELVVYAVDDPDTVRVSVSLTPREAHELAESLAPHHNDGEPDDVEG